MARPTFIKSQFILSTIFETEEEVRTSPFEFDSSDLTQQSPSIQNYQNAKKMGSLMIVCDAE